MGALDGIKVLDLSRVIAGPYCCQMMADNGADVIKVEAPGGDMNRGFPTVIAPGLSTNFLSANRGKRGITLNLKSPEAQRIMHALVGKVDVVVQSFLPKTAAALGADYQTLAALNPRIIYASISGYGAKGALKDKPGYDTMVTAFAGIMSLTGEPDGPPARPGVIAVDMATAMLTYSGIVSALFARAEGRAGGQRVDASLLESAVALLSFRGLNYLQLGSVDQREGAGYNAITPYGAYRCADGDILIGAATQANWRTLCGALAAQSSAAESLIEDPRYADNQARCVNADALRTELEAILAGATMEQWLDRLEAAGVPSAPINTVDRVLDHPQVRANDMVIPAPTTDGGSMDMLGIPFNMSATPGKAGNAPPTPGQHTVEVLGEMLGMSEAEVEKLAEDGVL
ncbi:MAG: CoA transferase [Proteobacteria bacterium]|nr:CoA transferase [Pseudomonadota bacterium]